MSIDKLVQEDYSRARQFYSSGPPDLIGRSVLSRQDAAELPLDLDRIIGTAVEAARQNPARARQHAKTFGALSVNLALNGQPTSFSFDRVDSFAPPGIVEIATKPTHSLAEMFRSSELDSPTTYLLMSDGLVPIEMGLIQALHMIDTAIVTGQFDGLQPLIRAASLVDLAELRAKFSDEVFLRTYGNIRGSRSAPRVLGSVVPTNLLERSGVNTLSLVKPAGSSNKAAGREVINIERPTAVFMGITTAKTPHIGHGFLMVKSLAEAGANGRVVIELNDSGPRVDRAIVALAADKGITLQEAAEAVSSSKITLNEVEAAYRKRGDLRVPPDMPGYALSQPNAYYRNLLTSLQPIGAKIVTIADSELPDLLSDLRANPGFKSMLGGGMGILEGAKDSALLIEKRGAPTIAGILGALSTRYALKLMGIPPPLTQGEREIFKSAGLAVDITPGVGVMIDFEVGSGTKGNSLPLNTLVAYTETIGLSPRLVLPALRLMMNRGLFMPVEDESPSLNFASQAAAMEAFVSAVQTVSQMENPEALLFEPLKLRDAKRDLTRSLLAPLVDFGLKPKPSPAQARMAMATLPNLRQLLSPKLVDYADNTFDDGVIPKTHISEADRNILQSLTNPVPDKAIGILLDLAAKYPRALEVLVANSDLPTAMLAMGYQADHSVQFLTKIKSLRGVFKVV